MRRPVSVAALAAASSIALPTLAADRELGKHLSSECTTCHQLSGRAVGGVPPIVGIDQESFRALMNAYRTNERENEVMRSIATKLTHDEIAALAAYFESVKKK
jgi:cytochrome c553